MELSRTLHNCMADRAASATVARVTIGLSYTAVLTTSGHMGLAATGLDRNTGCSGHGDIVNYEGRPARDLLCAILENEPLGRAMALALINALNHPRARRLPDDPANRQLFDHFGIFSGARVAMVGYFPPLVRILEARKVPLTVIDKDRGIGDANQFYEKLGSWADVLLLTATSIINSTTETILAHVGPHLKTVVLGPSTPMLAAAFAHLPVHMLAGSLITDPEPAMRIVRHAGNARNLKTATRKVYCLTKSNLC